MKLGASDQAATLAVLSRLNRVTDRLPKTRRVQLKRPPGWTVGGFRTRAELDAYRENQRSAEYTPVIRIWAPGLTSGPEIARCGGVETAR